MGQGFLGTPASLMLDVVVCSLVLVLPVLIWGLYEVRIRKNYPLHKRILVSLTLVLAAVVLLFEIDLRMHGGFWELAKNSPHVNSAFLRNLLAVHLCFSISTVFIWGATFVTALRAFPNPPAPGVFSPKHKLLAWLSVADMVGTVVTGLMVYYYGFMAK